MLPKPKTTKHKILYLCGIVIPGFVMLSLIYNFTVKFNNALPNEAIPKSSLNMTDNVFLALKSDKSEYVRILSIDGGGVRNIISLHALVYLEEKSGKPISELFDIITGVTTGGFIAAILTIPDENGSPKYTAKDVLKGYQTIMSESFHNPVYHKLFTLNGFIGPEFLPRFKRRMYKHIFHDLTLNRLLNNVFIPAYDLKTRSLVLFNNQISSDEPNYYLTDVLMGATASPTFYPPTLLTGLDKKKSMALLDAGLFNNNPCLLGLLEGHKLYPNKKFVILSLGTGSNVPVIPPEESKLWGFLQWGSQLLNVTFTGTSEITDLIIRDYKQFEHLSIINYLRLNVPIDELNEHFHDTSEDNFVLLNRYGHRMILQHEREVNDFLHYLY